jgi:hypothetical protein
MERDKVFPELQVRHLRPARDGAADRWAQRRWKQAVFTQFERNVDVVRRVVHAQGPRTVVALQRVVDRWREAAKVEVERVALGERRGLAKVQERRGVAVGDQAKVDHDKLEARERDALDARVEAFEDVDRRPKEQVALQPQDKDRVAVGVEERGLVGRPVDGAACEFARGFVVDAPNVVDAEDEVDERDEGAEAHGLEHADDEETHGNEHDNALLQGLEEAKRRDKVGFEKVDADAHDQAAKDKLGDALQHANALDPEPEQERGTDERRDLFVCVKLLHDAHGREVVAAAAAAGNARDHVGDANDPHLVVGRDLAAKERRERRRRDAVLERAQEPSVTR